MGLERPSFGIVVLLQFTEIIFVDHQSSNKTYFTQKSSQSIEITAINNYGKLNCQQLYLVSLKGFRITNNSHYEDLKFRSVMIFCSFLDSLCLGTLVIVQSIATAGVLTRSNRGFSAPQPMVISPEWLSTPEAITL